MPIPEEFWSEWDKQAAPFATAIGQLSFRFVEMEHEFDVTIHRVLKVNEPSGLAITNTIQSFALRLNILAALLHSIEIADETRCAIMGLIDKASETPCYTGGGAQSASQAAHR